MVFETLNVGLEVFLFFALKVVKSAVEEAEILARKRSDFVGETRVENKVDHSLVLALNESSFFFPFKIIFDCMLDGYLFLSDFFELLPAYSVLQIRGIKLFVVLI